MASLVAIHLSDGLAAKTRFLHASQDLAVLPTPSHLSALGPKRGEVKDTMAGKLLYVVWGRALVPSGLAIFLTLPKTSAITS